MSVRSEQLAQKRRQLEMRCALQRQQVAHLACNIEARLTTADRIVDVASTVVRNPVVLIGTIAVAMMLGPWRILKWASQAALLFKAVTAVRRLTFK